MHVWLEGAFQVAQLVKNLPAKQETRVPSLSREDSPGGGHGNPLSILAWRVPRTEEPDGPQSMGPRRGGHERAS